MFSRKEHNALIGFIFFLVGALISYVGTQYSFLKVNTEINIFEFIMSIGTIGIGLYIAIILERNRNKSQNFYSYVESKYDALWEDFIKFSEVLEISRNIELNESSKRFKSLYQKLTPLIKIFDSFNYDSQCLKEIEGNIESLDDFISHNPNIVGGIVDLDAQRADLINILNGINESFASSFKKLSDI